MHDDPFDFLEEQARLDAQLSGLRDMEFLTLWHLFTLCFTFVIAVFQISLAQLYCRWYDVADVSEYQVWALFAAVVEAAIVGAVVAWRRVYRRR